MTLILAARHLDAHPTVNSVQLRVAVPLKPSLYAWMPQEDAVKIHLLPSLCNVMDALMAKTVYILGNKLALVYQDAQMQLSKQRILMTGGGYCNCSDMWFICIMCRYPLYFEA